MVEAKPEEFSDFRCLLFRIDLIDNQESGRPGASKKSRKFLIGGGYPGAAIDDKKDERGALDCYLGLFKDAKRDFGFFARNNTPGIDKLEGASVPVGRTINTVAGNAGLVSHYRTTLPYYPIE